MADTELLDCQKAMQEDFNSDSTIIGNQTIEFLKLVYPSYLVDKENLEPLMDSDSSSYRFCRCRRCHTSDTGACTAVNHIYSRNLRLCL